MPATACSSSATRARRTPRYAGSRAGSQPAKPRRSPPSRERPACRACSGSTARSSAAAIYRACRSTKRAPRSRAYFVDALRVLRRLHRAGIAHNDLAKEANWLVTAGDACAIIDFQLATRSAGAHGPLPPAGLRGLAPSLEAQANVPAATPDGSPARACSRGRRVPTRLWRALVKPPYLFVTRVVLGWPERAGPVERNG